MAHLGGAGPAHAADQRVRRVLHVDRTGRRVGPVVEVRLDIEVDTSLRYSFQIAIGQAGQRWVGSDIGAQYFPGAAFDLQVIGGQLSPNLRPAG